MSDEEEDDEDDDEPPFFWLSSLSSSSSMCPNTEASPRPLPLPLPLPMPLPRPKPKRPRPLPRPLTAALRLRVPNPFDAVRGAVLSLFRFAAASAAFFRIRYSDRKPQTNRKTKRQTIKTLASEKCDTFEHRRHAARLTLMRRVSSSDALRTAGRFRLPLSDDMVCEPLC